MGMDVRDLVTERREMILNLTQHDASTEQRAAGVVELPPERKQLLRTLLTFKAQDLVSCARPEDAVRAVRDRAAMIVAEFVLPILEERARAVLKQEHVLLPALQIVRPSVAASGLKALIGGAPYLMRPLEEELLKWGVTPVYAVSDRVAIEEPQPDGSVKKTAVFRHVGFIEIRN